MFVFATTGVPDRAQGGSGIFNYLLIDHLLNHGYRVFALFRTDRGLELAAERSEDLQSLKGRGLKYEIVGAQGAPTRLDFGAVYMRKIHRVDSSFAAVERHIHILRNCTGCIALDLGWAIALKRAGIPALCILGDPVPAKMKYSVPPVVASKWKKWVLGLHHKLLGFSLRRVFRELAPELAKPVKIGMFTPQHAQELCDAGIDCSYLRFATPDPFAGRTMAERPIQNRDGLVLLHVGTLVTTASYNMVRHFETKVMPALISTGIPIEIRFVGKQSDSDDIVAGNSNVKVTSLGQLEFLDEEFQNADLFFAPINYPIGARTRVMTALSYGIPILADRTVAIGIPELVAGRDILYADSRDEIADAIINVHQNRQWANVIGTSGRKMWEQFFSPDTNLKSLINISLATRKSE